MATSMIRWRIVICYCTAALLLLSNQATEVSSQDNAVFTIPITQLAQGLSTQFSNIVTQNLGVDVLEQAFQGSDVFIRQSVTNAQVIDQINNAKVQELYNRTIQLINEALAQATTRMYSEELIEECCEITAKRLGPCCHQCQSQSESDRNYLINVAGVLSNGSTFLFNGFNSIQVRFEVGHQSGALLEMPGINIGILGDCTTRNSLTEDWYESTINATAVVAQSVRSTDGGFFLSIAMASNGMVVRALIKMTDLFTGLVELLHRRPSSYWFVLNSQEDIFYYPQLPAATNVPIRQLEGELQTTGILADMTRSIINERTVTKKYLLPMGPSVMYGYAERSVMATYIYQPILADSAVSLSICVILAEEDRISATIKPTNPQDFIGANTHLEPFYHCSFATGATNHERCSYYCQSASRDALSVYLTDPSNPPISGDSVDLSTMVNLYLESGMAKPDWVQEGVATEAARASVSLNPVWTSQPNSGINSAISWRYAAFPSGLLLNHPAAKIDPNLEFTDLPWYSRALAHPGLMTLSPAIPDPRRTGLIYSISKALYVPNGNTATVGGPVLSVVAGDISLSSLHVTINSMEPLCTQKYYSCFLIDTAGMIIYHPSYLTTNPSKVPSHITTLHTRLYNHLVLQDDIIEKSRCNDYYNSAVNVSERSFSMLLSGFSGVATNNNSGSCDKYQFTRIPDTNVFLAIEYSPDCRSFVFCSCRQYESSLQTCVSCPNNDPPTCDCPCTCHLRRNTAVSSVRSCPIGPTEQPPSYSFEVNAPSGLSLCYNQECRGIKDQNTCNASRECTWCFTQCTRLADCCENSQANLLPNCVSSVCRNTDTSSDDDVSSGAIAGAVVGVIFVILVIGCLILVLVWYNFIRKEDPNAPKQENEFDFSKSRSSSDTQSQEPLSKKAANKTDSRVEERDSNGANIVTPDTIQLSNPLYANNTTSNNNTEQPPPAPMPETDL